MVSTAVSLSLGEAIVATANGDVVAAKDMVTWEQGSGGWDPDLLVDGFHGSGVFGWVRDRFAIVSWFISPIYGTYPTHLYQGGGFKHVLFFTPDLGEDFQYEDHIFRWVVSKTAN